MFRKTRVATVLLVLGIFITLSVNAGTFWPKLVGDAIVRKCIADGYSPAVCQKKVVVIKEKQDGFIRMLKEKSKAFLERRR